MKIQLAADSARFLLTLNADPGNAWRYNLPKPACHNARNSRVASGAIIAPDYRAALRQITVVPGRGYEPGTVERGLSGTMAAEPQATAN